MYSGTYVRSGNLIAKVFATGMNTKYGAIAKLTLNVNHLTEYEKNLRKLTRDIILIAVFSLGIIFVLHSIFKPEGDFLNLLIFIIAISITVIPEALPAIATITLSGSALKLARKGVVTKQLKALESLGNVDIICTDKTGTLTENKLRIIKTDINPKYQKEFFKYCHLSAAASNDPFDIAIQEMLTVSNFTNETKLPSYEDVPFDPFKKTSARRFSGFTILKGAPEVLIRHSHANKIDAAKLLEEDSKGYRILGLAIEEEGQKISYIATLHFYDPIKTDVAETMHHAELQGIAIKIITGDSLGISKYVGHEVGILKDDNEIIDASELVYEEPKVLEQQVERYKIFCRADPIQKYKIIEALQTTHQVAYLGDGINDAPSLQLADVGIVVDSASDIAKSTADIILLKKN
ncbi:MAG: HAD-IC family P-type ATPase, partial [Pseudomonadota bacterium]